MRRPDPDPTPEAAEAIGLVVAVHAMELRSVLDDLDDVLAAGHRLPLEGVRLHGASRLALAVWQPDLLRGRR